VRIAIVAVAVFVVGGWAVLGWLRSGPRVVSVDEVLNNFRATTTIPGQVETFQTHPIPEEGVYTYATSGTESLNGPLSETHTYPLQSAVTVTRTPCGFTWRWDVFERRSDVSTWCWTGAGLIETDSSTDHIFFKVHDKRGFVCSPPAIVLPKQTPPTSPLPGAVCEGGDTVNTKTVEYIGHETLSVAGVEVETVVMKNTDVAGNKSTGESAVTMWLRPSDGLVVKMHRQADIGNDSIIGKIHYLEDITLVLTSLTPQS
jgi:hypothetical protein